MGTITLPDTYVVHVDYSMLKDSLDQKLIGKIDIDVALMRVLTQRFQLGMFDPPEQQPWSTIPIDVVGSQQHLEAAVEAVRRGESSAQHVSCKSTVHRKALQGLLRPACHTCTTQPHRQVHRPIS